MHIICKIFGHRWVFYPNSMGFRARICWACKEKHPIDEVIEKRNRHIQEEEFEFLQKSIMAHDDYSDDYSSVILPAYLSLVLPLDTREPTIDEIFLDIKDLAS